MREENLQFSGSIPQIAQGTETTHYKTHNEVLAKMMLDTKKEDAAKLCPLRPK